jgi:catechol 2,3-dioxygenase-like lactoylglutathione lyase family enzyme
MIGGMILFARGEPTATSVGSAIDHIAIRVPDLQPYVAGLAKTRYKVSPVAGGGRLMIDGPDGARIELIEDDSMYARLEFDHIHFFTPRPKETQAWYGRIFGARPGTDELANTSRVQGAVLTFSAADSAAPTAGRAIDHIAFEIKDLETFCRSLEAQGIKLDSPYKKVPELGMASAFLTDPWGTRIELTEGLGR